MKPITFPEQTTVWAKNQPEYLPLPAYGETLHREMAKDNAALFESYNEAVADAEAAALRALDDSA